MEQKNKRVAREKKAMKLEAAEETRRMAAEEGGALYLLRPHEVLPGQHIDLFVGRRVPVEGGGGSSLFIRIPSDSRAPTNQQVGHPFLTLHDAQLVLHARLKHHALHTTNSTPTPLFIYLHTTHCTVCTVCTALCSTQFTHCTNPLQVNTRCLQFRSHSLHEVAQLLSHTVGCPEEETLAGLQLLYEQLVLQQSGLFTALVTTNKAVIRTLLWQSPEQTSAAQHSNGLANAGMEKLRRVIKKSLGFSPFSCKGNVARHDKEALYYITKENFEAIKLQLYHTANSTVPSPCAALRARNLPNYLELMVRRVLVEQQDHSTRNLRHPLYRGRLVLIIELDKGGKLMKFAWRLGANRLVPMGAFEATDSHGNIMIYMAPWYSQLKEIMDNGVIVASADFQELAALDQEVAKVEKEPVLRDLRTEPATGTERLQPDPPQLLPGQAQTGGEEEQPAAGGDGEQPATVRLPVDISYAGDMAGFYMLLGLSGAAGLFPSLFTLVTKSHLAQHAQHDDPHNWENEKCIFPFRYPEQIKRNNQACSRDKRNGGAREKNARYHQGQKASPLIPFPKGLKDFLGLLSTLPLHVDLGVIGKWVIERGILQGRILDGKASEAELADINDQLLEERGEEEEGEGEPANAPRPGPITRERTRLQQELLKKALEKELAELEKEEKQEELVKLEVVLPRLVAGMEGDEETLLALAKKSGATYFKKKFRGDSKHLTCFSHCLLTGRCRVTPVSVVYSVYIQGAVQ
jgi:hypothetical protein